MVEARHQTPSSMLTPDGDQSSPGRKKQHFCTNDGLLGLKLVHLICFDNKVVMINSLKVFSTFKVPGTFS